MHLCLNSMTLSVFCSMVFIIAIPQTNILLITIQNLEKLEKDPSPLGKIYNNLKEQGNSSSRTALS